MAYSLRAASYDLSDDCDGAFPEQFRETLRRLCPIPLAAFTNYTNQGFVDVFKDAAIANMSPGVVSRGDALINLAALLVFVAKPAS